MTREGKSEEETYSQVEQSIGEYLTFGGLVKTYGGWKWPAAVVGAQKTATHKQTEKRNPWKTIGNQ